MREIFWTLFLVNFGILNVHCSIESHPNWEFLDRENCGSVSTDRIVGGKEVSIGAFPWMAAIGYLTKGEEKPIFKCGGSLINKKFVLTAAHCVTKLPFGFTLKEIRLGERDLETDPDCEGDNCADPVQSFEPEEVFFPDRYDEPKLKNDVGLIKLEKEAVYTTWVSPICLPFGSLLDDYHLGRTAEVAGWGSTKAGSEFMSSILLTLSIKVVNNLVCKLKFPHADISYHQMCAGGDKGKDSCGGDSGGPLMLVAGNNLGNNSVPRYFAVGVVSFGSVNCGTKDTPAVYTRLPVYMSWILDHLR